MRTVEQVPDVGAVPVEAGTAQAVEAFVELVLADEDLLRAEFEAIVAASFAEPPGESAPRARHQRPRPHTPAPHAVVGQHPHPDGTPGSRRRNRQRSPPA